MRGKAMQTITTALVNGDHPRLCGEKKARWECFPHMRGSPPPMRGKVLVYRTSLSESGITPAYAGKSAIFSCVQRSK